MTSTTDHDGTIDRREAIGAIDRREAIRRVSAILGGAALVGGSALLTACEREQPRAAATGDGAGAFSREDIAFLDEVADTILPTTSTPGAKAAQVGAFMALMVTDTYDEREQRAFRDGMRALDEACRQANGAPFMSATPAQRLALLERLDREQKAHTDARQAAREASREAGTGGRADTADVDSVPDAQEAAKRLPDQRQEAAPSSDVGGAAAITADAPAHYFRMMKELALLGYFTSEIGYTQAMRYEESPGRFDPCVPYTAGEKSWAPHA